MPAPAAPALRMPGKSAGLRSLFFEKTIACSMAFLTWRTLPGQEKDSSSRSASGVKLTSARPWTAMSRAGRCSEERGEQVRGKRQNGGGARAQRRHGDDHHVQAEEEVLAETPRRD